MTINSKEYLKSLINKVTYVKGFNTVTCQLTLFFGYKLAAKGATEKEAYETALQELEKLEHYRVTFYEAPEETEAKWQRIKELINNLEENNKQFFIEIQNLDMKD